MKIINIICDSQNNELTPLVMKKIKKEGHRIDIWQFGTSDIDNEEKYFRESCKALDKCSLVIIRVHAGLTYFKKFDRLKEEIIRCKVSLIVESGMPQDMEETKSLFKGSEDDYITIRSYIELGGEDNEYNLLTWLLKKNDKIDIEVNPPIRKPAQGLYVPEKGIVNSIKIDKEKTTIAVLFNQVDFVNNNLLHIDSLIKCLKSKNVNVLPIFLTSNPNNITGSIGINGTINKYLISNRKTIVDSVILALPFSQLCMSDPNDGKERIVKNIFDELCVPVIQAVSMFSSKENWESNSSGLGPFELSMSIFWPEYDGQIISVPLSSTEHTTEGRMFNSPIDDRVNAISELAIKWAELKHTPPAKRKIAILLHQNPPRNDMIGGAFGLDAQESTSDLLKKLQSSGYFLEYIPSSGQELTKKILEGVSNDSEWLSASEMKNKAAAMVSGGEYSNWFSKINEKCRERMISDWGTIPGNIHTIDGNIVIPGIIDGHIFIGLQPNRGLTEDSVDIYHSQEIVVPHNYLAFYRWLTDVFGAQAIIHMGCHGTLEWLPGKGTGLSSSCFPDLVFGHLPHIYPYAMSNPGEGVHAKRRNGAVVIDHLIPAFTRSGSYDELAEMESMLQEYLRAKAANQNEKINSILNELLRKCIASCILDDIGLSQNCSIDDLRNKAETLYDYICNVKDNIIKDGLHILGRVPKEERMDEMLYSLTRMQNGNIPSLRSAIAYSMSFDIDQLQNSPSLLNNNGLLNGEIIDDIDKKSFDLIVKMRDVAYDKKQSEDIASEMFDNNGEILSVIDLICDVILPNINKTVEELNNIIRALDGDYILPGPSGCITRGNVHLLPSGRNFYSIDPASIPTISSWHTGAKMAEQMIERHIAETGSYPKQVGIVIWSTDTMKTGGDDIAYILHLLGLKPIWSSIGGSVVGLRIVPLAELKRPRIDVTLRISGLFRDSFPNLIDLMDDGIKMISELNESDEENYFLAHLRKDLTDSIAKGIDPIIAEKKARVRIFGDPPGNYGAGVDSLIENSKWDKKSDLAEAYIQWGGYAYGKEFKGEDLKDYFKKRMSEVDVTVKNHESRELDAFDNDDDYVFLGGMNATVESCKGKVPMSVIGDSSSPDNTKIRTLTEEGKFIFRSRILNPKWIDGLKKHSYRGVQELSNLVDFSFGWDSTSDIMEDWMYKSMTEKFLFDGDTKQWIEENNPDALRQITSRLLEAIERGMWNADNETLERLKSMFLDSESALEGINDR